MLTVMATTLALAVVGQDVDKAPPIAQAAPRPTQIRLDFQDQTLDEIVAGINAQAPRSVAIASPSARRFDLDRAQRPLPARRFSLHAPEPMTFWEAVDRVRLATGTLAVSGNSPEGHLCMRFMPASPDRGFVRNDGVLRIQVIGTTYTSAYMFAPYFFFQPGVDQPKRDGSSRRPIVHAQLLVTSEPRLKVIGIPEAVVSEAVDDRGRDLLDVTPWRESRKTPYGGAKGFPNEDWSLIPLKDLDDPGKMIKRLRGRLTVEVSAREPESPSQVVEATFDFSDIPLP